MEANETHAEASEVVDAEGAVVEETAAPEAPGAEAPDPASEHEIRAQEYLALAQRTQADFENFRKRAGRDLAAAEQRGIARTVKELLPALDNLERALAAMPAGDGLAEGVRLVQAEMHGALARVGVEGYSPKGERFDPTVHEAVAQQPVEGAESGTVAEVFQPGYRKDDLVIRPARVLVAA